MIVFHNLKVGYCLDEAIAVPDFNLNRDEPLCLLGRSGVGKTTLLHTMLGLLPPLSGEMSDLPAKKAALFQEDRLIEAMTGLDNVRLVLPKHRTKTEVAEHFRLLGLEKEAERPVSEYSGGMRRRVGLIRAMMGEADFIALDEAFQGLDSESRKRALHYILNFSKNKYLIVATHEMEDVSALGAKTLYL